MPYQARNANSVLIPILMFLAVAPALADASTTIRNIAPTHHSAPAGTSLAAISAAIKLAANAHGWIITEETPGTIQASLRIRTHIAMVTIGYDESNYWIEYRDSTNLDYNPDDRKKTRTMRAIKGPRIHRNYNIWVAQLAESIMDHARTPPKSLPAAPALCENVLLIADELEKLDALRERGVLTQGEFSRQKTKLLAQ